MKTPPLDAVSSADALRKRPRLALVLVGLGALLGLLSLSVGCNMDSASSNIANSYLRATTPLPRFLQEEPEQCTESCCLAAYSDLACEEAASTNPLGGAPLYVQIIMIVLLIIMSAFFSGLTLGLMGLDKTGLEIVMEGDDERFKEYATKIYPLRKRGNLLLCTLLLGNVAVNSLLSILTADKFGGTVGLLSSTFLIVIFGEITPQAFCQRYSLEVGSAMVPVVRVILVLFYPIAFPLSYALDKALGEELATTYSSSEMLKLLQIHVAEEVMHPDTATAMKGALKFKDLTVKEVMTPVAMTFMLSAEEHLTFETIAKIFKTGYSRIPIYHVSKNNIIGLLFVKDLIFIDPEDNTRIQDFIEIFGRALHTVWPDDTLGDVLRELRQGKSHMALVRGVNNEDESKDPFYEIKGIITLEDIIEEIIGAEIVDETDTYVDGTHSEIVDRGETFKWASLRLLDAKIVDETLSYDETRAVTAHLMRNYASVVSLVTENQLNHLISTTPVSVLPTAIQEVGQEFPDDTMYKKGEPNDTCTLILSGKVKVIAGADNFRTDVSSWSVLGAGALQDPNYQPDFTAFVRTGPCRCLRLTRAHFSVAVDASTLERQAAASGTPAVPFSSIPEYKTDSTGPTGSGTRKQKLITALQAVNTTESVHPVGRRAVKAASVTRLNQSSHSEGLPPLEEEQTDAPDTDAPSNEVAAGTSSSDVADGDPIE